MENKKFLDYDGFKKYHDSLVKTLRNLSYDPQRMFESKEELLKLSNWTQEDGVVYGLKEGLIVTVGDYIWQLEDPKKFKGFLNTIGIQKEKALLNEIGWKSIGSTLEFEVDGNTLKLFNNN